MRGGDLAAVGHLNTEGIVGDGFGATVGAGREEMASGTGVDDGFGYRWDGGGDCCAR